MRRFLACLPLALVLLAPATTEARDMNGKFGLGYEQTLGGVSGIHLKYHVRDFVIQGIVGFDLFKPKDLDPRTAVKGSVGVVYNFARFEIANLGVGIRADLGWRNGEAVTADARKACVKEGGTSCDTLSRGSRWQVNLEVPLVAELFFTDHFAVSLQAGVLFTFVTQAEKALPQSTGQMSSDTAEEGFGFGFGGGSLFGAAGFTVYF